MILDSVMFTSNLRKKETADRLKRCVLNYFAKNTLNVRTTYDMLLELIPVFASLFNTDKMPKNDIYIKSVVEQSCNVIPF
jgi:hypothetical protein